MRNIRTLAWVLTLCLAACDARPVDYDPVALDPCGAVADVALQKQILQLLIGGAMNEKLDPKVAPVDALILVKDAYRQKTGELRSRNAWAQITSATDTGANLAACRALFPLQGGNLGLIGSLASPSTADALYEYVPSQTKWIHNTRGYQPMPLAVTTLTPVESKALTTGAIADQTGADFALAGNLSVTAMVDQGGSGKVGYVLKDITTGDIVQGLTAATVGTIHRVAAGGSTWLVVFVLNSSSPGTITATVINASTLSTSTFAVTGASVVSGSKFDVMPKPGSNNILVVYANNAGGVTALEFNPSTGAIVTGPTTYATGGGTISGLAWCPDPSNFSPGFFWLGITDSVSGTITKKITTGLVLSATATVNAAYTIVPALTGYVSSAGPAVNLIWNDIGANLVNSAGGLVGGLILLSKAFLVGGHWYVIACTPNAGTQAQPTAFIVAADTVGQDVAGSRLAGIMMPGQAGGPGTSFLITSAVTSGTKVLCAVARVTRQAKTTFESKHQVLNASIEFSPKLRNPRELSGTVFFPGGMVTQFDGTSVDLATFPLYPDSPIFTTAVGGSMTPSGVYQYVGVFKTIDASGRIRRSAPSIPLTVTLGAGDHSAQVSFSTLRIGVVTGITDPAVEFYRAGPAAAGGIVYNKVGEVASTVSVGLVTFNDTTSDTAAASGELLYDPLANNGVLNNFPSPSTQLLEVLDNRVFVVSAENPTEVWASKEYKTGAGLAFNPALVQRFTGGPITALAAMDGRLVVFQGATTWIWPIGPGPNDQGQGTFGDPQLASLNVGCVDPNSVVATPDGIMFQAAQGIYLLTRGLDMQFIGGAVEDSMATIKGEGGFAGASLAPGTNQVRFVCTDAVSLGFTTPTLVYDYFFKQWYRWNPPSLQVALVGATSAGGVSYYADANGNIFQETSAPGLENGLGLQWSFTLPHLALGQLGGRFLAYEVQVIGTYVGPHTLALVDTINYGTNTMSGSRVISSSPPAYQMAFRPRFDKSGAMQLRVVVTPSGAAEGARISALSLVYGGKPGRFPLPANRRLG